jgi:tRNA A37 threonylcarbamoyladenosine dehydratase
MTGAVGQMKVQVLAERFLNIHPQIVVNVVMEKFDSSTASRLLQGEIDFVVDATDGFHEKCLLMSMCKEYGLPMVTVGGSGGRRDPTAVRIADLAKTHGDRLLQKTRKELRFKYAMGMKGKPFGIPCVYSSELPYYPAEDGCVTQDPSFRPRQRLDCSSGMGTVVTVTATFGFFAASVALSGIAEKV